MYTGADNLMALFGFISPILAYLGLSITFLMPLLKSFILEQKSLLNSSLDKTSQLIQALKKGKSKLFDKYLSLLLSLMSKLAAVKKMASQKRVSKNNQIRKVKKVGKFKKLLTAFKKAAKAIKKQVKLPGNKTHKLHKAILTKHKKVSSLPAKAIKQSKNKQAPKTHALKAAFKEIAKNHYKKSGSDHGKATPKAAH